MQGFLSHICGVSSNFRQKQEELTQAKEFGKICLLFCCVNPSHEITVHYKIRLRYWSKKAALFYYTLVKHDFFGRALRYIDNLKPERRE